MLGYYWLLGMLKYIIDIVNLVKIEVKNIEVRLLQQFKAVVFTVFSFQGFLFTINSVCVCVYVYIFFVVSWSVAMVVVVVVVVGCWELHVDIRNA